MDPPHSHSNSHLHRSYPPAQHLQLNPRLHIFTLMKVAESISDMKVDVTRLLMASEDQALIAEIHALLLNAADDDENWYENLDEADKASIARGEADIAAGRVISQKDLMEESRSWGKR